MQIFFKVLIVILFLSFDASAKDSSRFSVGVGIFNYMEDGTEPHKDQSQMMNLELSLALASKLRKSITIKTLKNICISTFILKRNLILENHLL